MAKEPRHRQSPDALKSEIARSRDQLAREFRGLRYELDIPQKIRRSLREHTALWVGAAVVVGALIVFLPSRKREGHVDLASGKRVKPQSKLLETGFVLGVARVAAAMLKPTITKFIAEKMGTSFAPRTRADKW